ncbi:hypothetical protein [Salinibacter phage M8CRM-1]|uniref:Uncharacterized protein n=3 Tax=Kryptosalinivirus TaxID=2560163 RepID=A0A2I6UGH5_9CAUD|nr:hypothetical protein FGG63_gp65 [Salinibacter phage M8CC-19]YP_009639531.1 hypothetical protein FGG67_gp65 [Salinibacter phage M8CRM-1]AUO79026.1 hypothetical protein [Salinibacter phage M8CC-19]AUO79186.1 hypothetical protein [Salinibacter phage M8CRM-1]AUO79259.1 hypothetical protein [Salinibacter phage M31CC-1]
MLIFLPLAFVIFSALILDPRVNIWTVAVQIESLVNF